MRSLQTLIACIVVLLAMLLFDSNTDSTLIILLLLNTSIFSFASVVLRGVNKLYWSQVIWVSYWLFNLLLQINYDTMIAFLGSSMCVALFSVYIVYKFAAYESDYINFQLVRATLILGSTGVIDAIVRRLDLLILLKMVSSVELAAYYLLQKNFDIFNQASQVLSTVYLNFRFLTKLKNMNFVLISVIWLILMLSSYIVFKYYVFEYFSAYTFNAVIFIIFGFSGLLTYFLTPLGLDKIVDAKYTQILLSSIACLIVTSMVWWLALIADSLEVFSMALSAGVLTQIIVLKIGKTK